MKNWKKNIFLFMFGQGLTLMGSMIVHYAILWDITLKTGSGMMMMLIAVLGAIPMFFISPFGGIWADRYNKKHLINISDGIIALVTLILALTFFVGYQQMGLLLICVAIRSLGGGVQMPAVNSLIPELVPKDKLIRINGIKGSIQSLTMLISPMLAGALLFFIPIQAILFIDVITAAIGISILYFFVKVDFKPKKEKLSYFQDLKKGFSYVKKNNFIKKFIILAAIFNIMVAPMALLTPLQVTRNFGADVWRLTTLQTTFAIGMMLGGLIIAVWGGFKNKIHTLALATIMTGIGIVTLGILNNFWLYIACMGITGIVAAIFNAPLMTILQINIKEIFMGRVLSILTMVNSVAMPIGMLIWGPLSDIVNIDWLLIGTGFIIFLLSFIFFFDKTFLKAGIKIKRT